MSLIRILGLGLLSIGIFVGPLPLAAQTSIAGTYTGTEKATVTATVDGESDTETFTGTNSNVVVTQTGLSFQFTTTDPSSGISVTRTGTISGTSITSITGPAFGFKTGSGVVAIENKITSGTGTIHSDRIEIRVVGYATGSVNGTSGRFDLESEVVLRTNKPIIGLEPESQSVGAGKTATFATKAVGDPVPTYQWMVSSDGGATWANVTNGATYSGAMAESLVVAGVSMVMDGYRFRCVATNALGSATSGTAVLTVRPFSPVAHAVSASAQNYTLSIGLDGAWSVGAAPAWLKLTPTSGSGAGTVSVDVEANAGASTRQATIEIGGYTHTLTQLAHQAIDEWSWVSPQPQGNTLYGVAWSGTLYVTVGARGTILTSADGNTWTPRTSGANEALNSVRWINGQFIATGSRGNIATSSDGIAWTVRSSGSARALADVVWSGTQYVAVGASGTILSSPDGVTWTSRLSGTDKWLASVAFGNNTFVAVGDAGTIVTSPNGTDWTVRTSGTSQALRGVVWGNSIFKAVGFNDTVMQSPDGVAWQVTEQNFYLGVMLEEPIWDGRRFLTVGTSGGRGCVHYSPDHPLATIGTVGLTDTAGWLRAVLFTGTTYVAVGDAGTIATSANGDSWTRRTVGYAQDLRGFCVGPEGAMAGGYGVIVGGGVEPSWEIKYDPPESWTNLNAIVWTGARYIAAGESNLIWGSTDGSTWTTHSGATSSRIWDLAWNGALAVAVGRSGAVLTSPDGANWTDRLPERWWNWSGPELRGVLWAEGAFLVCGDKGTLLSSRTGETWTVRSAGTNARLNAVAHGNGLYVAVGSSGTILTSTDAVGWVPRVSGVTSQLNHVVWSGSEFVAAGDYGWLLTSTDGVTWIARSTPTTSTFNRIGLAGADLYLVGAGGCVLKSIGAVTASTPAAPAVFAEPIDVTVAAGTSAVFSAAAAGNPIPSYQWQRMPSGTSAWTTIGDGGSYTGATSATLTVSATTTAMSGDQFRCVVSNGTPPDATSNAAKLTVTESLPLPTVIDQPDVAVTSAGAVAWFGQTTTTHDRVDTAQSGKITHSQTSEFTVTTSASGSGSFWWKVSSESGCDYLRFYIDGIESGSISGEVDWQQKTFSLSAGSHTLKWAYTKDRSFSRGSDCGWVDQLSLGGPMITSHPQSVTVAAGANATFSVVATGSPAPTFQWQRQLPGSTTWSNVSNGDSYSGATTATLTVNPVTSAMNGDQFRCIVSNGAAPDAVSNTATLAEPVPLPIAVDQPDAAVTSAGAVAWFGQAITTHDLLDAAQSGPIDHNQTSEFSVTTSASGSGSFWWKVSSESGRDYLRFYIDGVEQSGSISGEVDWQLKTFSLPAGTHTLKWAYTKDGSRSSRSDCGWVDQLSLGSPMITSHPQSVSVTAGASATFSIAATGSPTPGYQWQRKPSGSSTWANVNNGGSYSGATTATLTVSATTASMRGDQFRCVASNGTLPDAVSNPATLRGPTTTDNFTDASMWGTVERSSNGANLTRGSGRMDYTTSNTENAFAAVPWNGLTLPLDSDWSAQVNMHISAFTLTQAGQFVDLFLAVGKTGDWLGNHVSIGFELGRWGTDAGGYSIDQDIVIAGEDAPNIPDVDLAAAPDIAVRIAYTAATRTLTLAYDADGATGGYAWTTSGTANIASGIYDMGLAPTDTFTLILVGSSEYQRVWTGNAYFSNLVVTVGAGAAGGLTITTQPPSTTVDFGTSAVFAVAVEGSPSPSYQWQRKPSGFSTWANISNSGSYSGATTATLTVSATTTSMNGDQFRCLISNGIHLDVTSNAATLTVNASAMAPVVTTQPASSSVVAWSIARFSAAAFGNPTPTYQWQRKPAGSSTWANISNGGSYSGATTATLTISAATTAMSGDEFRCIASNGTLPDATSDAATLTVVPFLINPGQPAVVSTPAGGATTLSVAVPGVAAPTFQWQIRRPAGATSASMSHPAADDDWIDIPGATGASYTIPSTQSYHGATYRVVVTAGGVSAISEPFTVQVATPPASTARVMNLSTRGLDLQGSNVLIPGFVITGTGTKRMLIRGVGPGMWDTFELAGYLADPRLWLRDQKDGAQIATNDDWGSEANAAEIATVTDLVGAFPLLPGSKDAALLLDLPAGHYSVPTVGNADGTGIAMVELYDADPDNTGGARLINISTRGFIDVGARIMIPGFVVSNEGSRTFLIRAVGPGMWDTFELAGFLADPVLTVFNSGGQPILDNDDWDGIPGAATTAAVSDQVGAFPLLPGSKDAAFVVTLPPGAYTIQASGKAATTGVALVEVYLVP